VNKDGDILNAKQKIKKSLSCSHLASNFMAIYVFKMGQKHVDGKIHWWLFVDNLKMTFF
jgi:hypothetical protein